MHNTNREDELWNKLDNSCIVRTNQRYNFSTIIIIIIIIIIVIVSHYY